MKKNLLDPIGAAERVIEKHAGDKDTKSLREEFKELGIWVSEPSQTGREETSLPQPSTIVRVIELAKKIAAGKTYLQLINEQMSNGTGRRMAETYYQAAVRFLTPVDAEEFKKGLIAKNTAKYEDLYQRAYEARQWKTCRDILDSLNKMYGLAGGNQVNIAENAEGDRVIQIKFD